MGAALDLLLALFLPLICISVQTAPEADYYQAAVVEYNGIQDKSLSALDNAKANVAAYLDIIARAVKEEKNLDIIVFPEIGLFGFDHTIFVEIPDPAAKIIPAKNARSNEILRNISQAAIVNKVYVVINLHESYKNGKEEYKYNTNVVFDRKGAIVARYRKYNLYGEKYLNRPEKPEYVTFKTDFGVTFGTFICFDIMFEEPAVHLINKYGVTDVVYPTAWFPELPFHIGIQEQSTWAYALNVNLLASGYNSISTGNTGSGIYAGLKGSIVSIESEESGTKILIGKVPKISKKSKIQPLEPGRIISLGQGGVLYPNIEKQDLKVFNTTLIQPEKLNQTKADEQIEVSVNPKIEGLIKEYRFDQQLCHNNFCCNFNMSFTTTYYQIAYNFEDDPSYKQRDAFYHYKYRLIAFNGMRVYPVGNTSGEQICAIMPCLDNTLDSCAKPTNIVDAPILDRITDKQLGELALYSTDFKSINISANFNHHRVLYLPNVIVSTNDSKTFGQPMSSEKHRMVIQDKTKDAHVSLSLTPEKFASGGLMARLFIRDNKPIDSNMNDKNIESCIYNWGMCKNHSNNNGVQSIWYLLLLVNILIIIISFN